MCKRTVLIFRALTHRKKTEALCWALMVLQEGHGVIYDETLSKLEGEVEREWSKIKVSDTDLCSEVWPFQSEDGRRW